MLSNRQRVKLSLDLKSENKLILPKKLQPNPALTTSMPSEQQAISEQTNKTKIGSKTLHGKFSITNFFLDQIKMKQRDRSFRKIVPYSSSKKSLQIYKEILAPAKKLLNSLIYSILGPLSLNEVSA